MSERAKPDLKWEDDEFVTLERYERLREALREEKGSRRRAATRLREVGIEADRLREALREIAPYAAGSPFAEKIIREALGDTPDE
jgi:hypothetical protein